MSYAVIAIDCDLHRIHAWCSECGEVCKQAANTYIAFQHVCYEHHDATILFEIASPVSGMRESGNAVLFNLTKWIIFNAATAADLARRADILVSPSNTWTRGHDLKTRHKLAGATAKLKDLRDCQAMIYSYQQQPSLWVPFATYLGKL